MLGGQVPAKTKLYTEADLRRLYVLRKSKMERGAELVNLGKYGAPYMWASRALLTKKKKRKTP